MVNSIGSGGSELTNRVNPVPLWFRAATAALAVAIFVADTTTPFECTVSILYVVVILMAGRFLQRRGTAWAASACVVMALTSAILAPVKYSVELGVANTLMSLAAISITSFLVLQSQQRERVLKDNAEQRKRTERELRESESRFRIFVDHATDAFFLHNEQLTTVDVNQQACHSLGYSREELIGMRPHDFDVGLDEASIARLAERVSAGETVTFESLHRRKEGTVFPVEVRVRPFSQGGRRLFLGVARDITERKRAEEELRASEIRYRTLVDHAADAILLRDEDGKLIDMNRNACESLGYTRDELLGMTPRDLVDPNEDPVFFRSVGERLNAGETFAFESGFRRKDGTILPVEVRVRPFSQGGQRFFLAIARDIRDRKSAEEKIRQQELELRQVLDFTPQLIAVFGPDRKRFYANRPALDYIGLTLEEWQGISDPLWFFHPDDRERMARDVYAGHEGDSSHQFEARFRRKDGTYRWFLFRDNPSHDEQGHIKRWYLSATDIEDRKQMEHSLRRSEAYLAEAQRLTQTGSWARDIAGPRVLYWSEETFRILGLDPRHGVPEGDVFLELIHPDDRERYYELRDNAIREAREFNAECRIVLPDGTLKYLHSIGHPVFDNSGNLSEYVGTVMDVTEQKRAEQERQKLHELEATLAHINRVSVMGEMTASIAHEINQPLSGVVSNGSACLRWLSADSPNLEEARDAARRIVRDGKRAGEIIAKIRALAKKSVQQRAKVNMNDTVREVLALVADEAKRRSISIRTEFAEDLAPVFGDRVQLQQVLLNIVMNAMDAMTETASKQLHIATQNSDASNVSVAVQDTGTGFDPSTMQKMFDPFYSTKSEGMGMGLSICRSIIQGHGGRLWAAVNDASPGATVQFTVPRYVEGAEVASA